MEKLKLKKEDKKERTIFVAGRSIDPSELGFLEIGYELLLINNVLFIDGRKVTSLSHPYIKEFISHLLGNKRLLRWNSDYLPSMIKTELECFNDTSLKRAYDLNYRDVIVARLDHRKKDEPVAFYIMLSRHLSSCIPTANAVAIRMNHILSCNGDVNMLDILKPFTD